MTPPREKASAQEGGLVADGGDEVDMDAICRELDGPTIGRVHNALAARLDDNVPAERWDFAIDRELAAAILRDVPHYPRCLAGQRRFRDTALKRAVTVDGFTQFIDYRAPVPDGPVALTVHDLVREWCPEPTVTVLVSREIFLAAHLKTHHKKATGVVVHTAAVDDADTSLTLERAGVPVLDLSVPIFVTMIDDLHRCGEPADLIDTCGKALPPGSKLAFTHLGPPSGEAERHALDALANHYRRTIEPDLHPRDRDAIESWFPEKDWAFEPPGVAPLPYGPGRPPADHAGTQLTVGCAVARKIR